MMYTISTQNIPIRIDIFIALALYPSHRWPRVVSSHGQRRYLIINWANYLYNLSHITTRQRAVQLLVLLNYFNYFMIVFNNGCLMDITRFHKSNFKLINLLNTYLWCYLQMLFPSIAFLSFKSKSSNHHVKYTDKCI